jgi:uncharacterized protein YgfB (UPF0149 family)
MSAAPDHAELALALDALRLAVGPSDLHGSLTGYLCGGGHPGDDWLAALELEGSPAAGDPRVAALRRACERQFDGPRADVQPLLPPAAAPLSQRAQALVEWCRGFLGGFGLGGASARLVLPAESNEILGDLGTIASSCLEHSDSAEEERAFAEVLAFVRTATSLLHRQVADARRHARASLH